MSEEKSESWRLFEIIEKRVDCLKIKCTLFGTEFIVSRSGYEKAENSTSFVFSRVLDWLQECNDFNRHPSTAVQSSWGINHAEAVRLHYVIGELIALDNEPLSVVEKRGFRRLMSKTAPQYKIPCRKYFSTKILPDRFKRVKEAVKLVLSEVQWISLTSDIWSCSGTYYSFISLTVHWLDDHFEKRSAALNVDVFPGSHTGDAIADRLTDLLASWSLDKIRVHLLMRDNGGNMAKECRVSDIGSKGCTIHTLQLVIKNTIEGNEAVSILLKKCKKISTFFHKSAPATTKLVQIQRDLNLKVKKLKQDVPTRWNSTFYLMLRFLELELCLDSFSEAEDDDSKSVTCAEWEILEELANLLQPFEEVTKSLS
ncbi:zinc finger BED domain-containing protein 4-like [Belonocnema kinseyi]|uniref:zinc finger BED domain-containing protein 4-like n=1 Tax=Belonocnema kinseyi TaxID=2817044 RepID=UPI00143D7460|nr:zinc finger BED domain-containing protein 4-like [Belonocnema kinseyi]